MRKKIYTGINIQWPISQEILSGKKIIETRTYPIPDKYIGQDMLLIETPGKSGGFKARAIAIIKFTSCFKYKDKESFYADSEKHLVTRDSKWSWKYKAKYGWIVEVLEELKEPVPIKQGGIIYRTAIKI